MTIPYYVATFVASSCPQMTMSSDFSDFSHAVEGQEEQPVYAEFDPRADTTKATHNRAIELFNRFAVDQKYPPYTNLTQDLVCGIVLENGSLGNPYDPPARKVFAEFATFLIGYKFVDSDGKEKFYQPGSILQYFSTLKAMLFKHFKPLGYFTEEPDWYKDLYGGLRFCTSAVCILCGGLTLSEMSLFLMKQNDQVLGYEERCVLVILFHAVGHGGEIAASTWNSAHWVEDRQMIV
jgi:hypothetical protein